MSACHSDKSFIFKMLNQKRIRIVILISKKFEAIKRTNNNDSFEGKKISGIWGLVGLWD